LAKRTTLKAVNSDLQSSADGQVIDACNVNGTIIVRHRDVTIRRSRALIIFVDPSGHAVTIEDCQVTGGPWNSGINLLSRRCVVRRCDISGVENGIWLEANGCLIVDNYIHDLGAPGSKDPHYDGLQIPESGVSDNIIRHNNFALARDVSSCITMKDAINITIDRNRLNGGTYIIYFEGNTRDCSVTNNVLGQHVYGVFDGRAGRAQRYEGNSFERS
jgi:hypothetical protein